MQTVCATVAEWDADMKNNGVKKSTMRVAFCGVIAALSLVIMMLSGVLQIGTYAFPCLAGILFTAVVVEYGCRWGFAVYAVVSLLSLVLSADKEAVVFFILIFGYYPILKNIIESKLKNKAVQFVIKLVTFNAAAIAAFYIGAIILSVQAEEYTIMGLYLPWVFLIIGNFFFVFYDYAVTLLVETYIVKIRKKFFK